MRSRDLVIAARVVVVAALLVLAALGTAGRRHLDWRDLLDPPRDRLASAVLLLAASALLAMVVRAVIAVLRRRARRARLPQGPERVPEEIPLERRTTVLLVAATLLLALGLAILGGAYVHHQHGQARVVSENSGNAGRNVLGSLSAGWVALALAAAVLLLGAGAATTWSRRRARRWVPGGSQDRTDAADEAVADAVAAAQASLAAHEEVRAGIIAAYEAMVRVLAGRGAPRRPSDTAADLLERALRASSVPAAAGDELSSLFREARFSSHPLTAADRHRAEAALAEVAASTGERAAARG